MSKLPEEIIRHILKDALDQGATSSDVTEDHATHNNIALTCRRFFNISHGIAISKPTHHNRARRVLVGILADALASLTETTRLAGVKQIIATRFKRWNIKGGATLRLDWIPFEILDQLACRDVEKYVQIIKTWITHAGKDKTIRLIDMSSYYDEFAPLKDAIMKAMRHWQDGQVKVELVNQLCFSGVQKIRTSSFQAATSWKKLTLVIDEQNISMEDFGWGSIELAEIEEYTLPRQFFHSSFTWMFLWIPDQVQTLEFEIRTISTDEKQYVMKLFDKLLAKMPKSVTSRKSFETLSLRIYAGPVAEIAEDLYRLIVEKMQNLNLPQVRFVTIAVCPQRPSKKSVSKKTLRHLCGDTQGISIDVKAFNYGIDDDDYYTDFPQPIDDGMDEIVAQYRQVFGNGEDDDRLSMHPTVIEAQYRQMMEELGFDDDGEEEEEEEDEDENEIVFRP